MKRIFLVLVCFLHFGILSLTSCGSEKSPSNRSPNNQVHKKGSNDQLEDKKSKEEQTAERGKNAYLLTIEDAKQLFPYVNPAPEQAINACPESLAKPSELGLLLEKFSNKTMTHKDLSPGRTFSFSSDSVTPTNAFFCSPDKIVLAGDVETIGSPAQLAAVTCHEMAHSSRNHLIPELTFRLGKMKQFFIDKEVYFQKTIKCIENDCSYTHDESAAQTLRESLDPFKDEYFTSNKLSESEADYIGMQICARSGMTPDQYIDYLDSFFVEFSKKTSEKYFEQYPQLQDMKKLESGKTYSNIPKELLKAVVDLYAISGGETTHPSNEERVKQLNLLKSLVETKDDVKAFETFLEEESKLP